jgi:hypothetical protein
MCVNLTAKSSRSISATRRCASKNQILIEENHLEPDITAKIRDLVGRHVIGHAGLGDMKLMEMFSPLGGPKDDDAESDINWIDDLKFFIDNDDALLKNHIFPTIEKHRKYVDHPEAYKLYMKPLKSCVKIYRETFDVDDEDNEKFSEDKICSLAKQIAGEQKEYIKKKDYDKK